MKNKHVFWGILFISIGILILINNFSSVNLAWASIWKLWPLVLVLWGITLLINNIVLKGFIIGITAIVLAVTFFAAFKSTMNFAAHGFEFTIDEDDKDEFREITFFNEPYDNSIQKAILNFKAGAGSFILKDTTSDLFFASAKGLKNNYNLSRNNAASIPIIEFKMKKTHFSFKHGKIRNKVEIKLNPLPIWNLNFDVGAASIDLDLRQYKIENIDFETGAASLEIRLGNLNDTIKFNLDAGASNVDIFIPHNSGCEIKTDAALSSKNFEGFTNIADDLYRTENFENSTKKIYLNIDAGISSIEVKRY